jgi:hypothetical protein
LIGLNLASRVSKSAATFSVDADVGAFVEVDWATIAKTESSTNDESATRRRKFCFKLCAIAGNRGLLGLNMRPIVAN